MVTFGVKNASGKVVVDGEKTKAVWQDYMENLMNEENVFAVVIAACVCAPCGSASLWSHIYKWTLCCPQATQRRLVLLQRCTGDYKH